MTRFLLALTFSGSVFAQTITSYEPLTGSERWKQYTKRNFTGPEAYVGTLSSAISAGTGREPREWGQGVQGYAHRLGYRYTTTLLDSSIRHSTAALLGHEVRYEASKRSGFFPRAGHALSRGFVTRNSSGHLVPNMSRFMGSYGGAMLGTYMRPDRYDPLVYGLQHGHVRLASSTISNLFREFSPDIKRMFRRHR